MVTKLQKELSLVLKELEKLDIMMFDVEWNGSCCGSRSWRVFLIDLFDQNINGFAGLDGNILIILNETVIKNGEENAVMFGGNQFSLKKLEDGDFFFAAESVFLKGLAEALENFFLEDE